MTTTITTTESRHLTPHQRDALVTLRHDLHAHPQTRYEETYANGVIVRRLAELGIEHVSGVAKTGVIGWVMPTDPRAANRPGVALRADMDALPIQEATGLPYASQNAGCMHACGHDGHTAILLGAAEALADRRDALSRPVKLLFQPAEETGGGAKRLVDAGVLTDAFGGFAAEWVYGLHSWPDLPVGVAASRPGPMMAGTDTFTLTIRGPGGHAARPHSTADPIVAGAQFVTAAQSLVARNVEPGRPAVVSITRFHGGDAFNIIPEQVELHGTLRHFDPTTRDTLHRRMVDLADGLGRAMGVTMTLDCREGYPPLVNDALCVDRWADAAEATGLEWHKLEAPLTVAEDFAFYREQAQVGFVYLGGRDEQHTAQLHTNTFDFNDRLIEPGVELMCRVAMDGD